MDAVVTASAGLLLAASITLAQDAPTDPVTVTIAVATVVMMLLTEIDAMDHNRRIRAILDRIISGVDPPDVVAACAER